MIKPLVLAALMLGAAPLAALADPMSVGGDSSLLAANTLAAPAASGGGASAMDPADQADAGDDDTVREPLATTHEPSASGSARPQPGAGHPPARAATHTGNVAHKKAETTRWQSLLPGVMK